MMRAPAAALLAAALIAGCGSGDDKSATSIAGGQTTAAPSIAGTYHRAMTLADVERTDALRREGAGQQKPQPGQLELTLRAGTLTVIDQRADVTVRQDFSATSDGALRIGAYQHPEKGSFCGPEVSQTAAYRWNASGDVLTLKAQQDECADRDSLLSGRWQRR